MTLCTTKPLHKLWKEEYIEKELIILPFIKKLLQLWVFVAKNYNAKFKFVLQQVKYDTFKI